MICLVLILSSLYSLTNYVSLYIPFNSGGLRGNITFEQQRQSAIVTIKIHLSSTTSTIPQQYEWTINNFPVFYDSRNPCSANEVGKVIHDMSRRHGPIQVPSIDNSVQTFSDSELNLEGIDSIWGKSMTLRNMNISEQRSCSNILTTLTTSGHLKTSSATLTGSITGNIVFRENEFGETLIYTNLFYTAEEYKTVSKNEWKILVSDIFDTKREQKCEHLQTLLDPNNIEDTDCSTTEHKKCKIGDLSRKLGMAVIGSSNNRYSKMLAIDMNLPLSAMGLLDSSRSLYVTIYDKSSAKRVLGCAQIHTIEPKEVKTLFNMDGVNGSIHFSQSYRTDPTVVTINLENLRGRGKWYQIHEYPIPPHYSKTDELCSPQSVGGHHNPFGINSKTRPSAGVGTNDQYEVGDLSGKYGAFSEEQDMTSFLGIYVDMNLPLFGVNSIVGRSVVIHKGNGDRWICANIGYPGPVMTAVATFVYPIVGKVIFRQERDKPWAETTVLTELSYSDGTVNNTMAHKWHIHTNTHNRDFYNWSRRCESAGPHFNPFGVGLGRTYTNLCNNENQFRCEVGDLTSKSKKLTVSAFKGSADNKHFYTDTLLPLSGPDWYSIIGRSVVVHDDNAPKQRGDRMACAIIGVLHPITAAVRYWRTNSGTRNNISGSIVFHQESEYDVTKAKVDLQGLNAMASGYHIHEVWVPIDKEFACSSDAVYSHFNPFGVDVSVGPFPEVGSVDQYEVGDISGKFGLLDNKAHQRIELIDPNLSLIGHNTVIGRSVVIHKKEKNFRWICGTIRPEEKKDMAREMVALASFDDPRSLISGFVRFRQFEYIDGSLSDTWIELDLRYPGLNNRNVTYNHKWAVYVSPVGQDAFNQIDSVRCLAAGYRWNPYLSKDDIEIYKKDCNPSNPFRCATGRQGSLSIGNERKVFSDENLPLIGNYSVMGRSLIIFKSNDNNIPIGCANIRPDIHLVSSVAIRKNPAFTVSKFMNHMRTLLNSADSLVVADVHKSKDIVNNECVQLLVNFFGSDAQKLQLEFSNLINLGTVKRSTRNGIESVSTFYKPCKTLNDNPNSGSKSEIRFLLLSFSIVLTILYEYFIYN